MRQLTLTNKQFEVLYDILADTVDYIEDDNNSILYNFNDCLIRSAWNCVILNCI